MVPTDICQLCSLFHFVLGIFYLIYLSDLAHNLIVKIFTSSLCSNGQAHHTLSCNMAPAALASSQLVVLITFWYYKYFPPSWWVGKHTHTQWAGILYIFWLVPCLIINANLMFRVVGKEMFGFFKLSFFH